MIKEINENDMPECVEVIKESFYTIANEFGFTTENAPRFTAFALTKNILINQLKNEHRPMYGYFDDNGNIIGYYSLASQNNEVCELNNLCVLPQYRHKHIGTKMLEDAYVKAKKAGYKKMSIGIVEENRVLRNWYEYNGFVHTGTKKFDFFPFTCGYMERDL